MTDEIKAPKPKKPRKPKAVVGGSPDRPELQNPLEQAFDTPPPPPAKFDPEPVLTVVTFKWGQPGYRSSFTAENVNITRRMVARHYQKPHRFICVTDDPVGLDPEVEVLPLWGDFASIPNPTWVNGPSCYRRLKVFSKWFTEFAGERIVVLDLDVVITGDLSPLWDRDEDFLIWRPGTARQPVCASMFMLRAGTMQHIWDTFDAAISPKLAGRQGFRGSDQAWIGYCIGRDHPGWTTADGVYGYKDHLYKPGKPAPTINIPSIYKIKTQPASGALPKDARVVMFTGRPDPWDAEALAAAPWIADHYK